MGSAADARRAPVAARTTSPIKAIAVNLMRTGATPRIIALSSVCRNRHRRPVRSSQNGPRPRKRREQIFERIGPAFEGARTRLDIAELAHRRGDSRSAGLELNAANRAFHSQRQEIYCRRTAELAAACGLGDAVVVKLP